MQKFNIAGICIQASINNHAEWIGNETCYIDMLKPFFSDSKAKPDLVISIDFCNFIPKPEGKHLLNEKINWVQPSTDKNSISVYICEEESEEVISLLNVNSNWSQASLFFTDTKNNNAFSVTSPLSEVLFRNALLFFLGIVIHASAVKWEGKGIIFTAPAGTGKSTQANLWKKFLGAEVLNGDRPAIRIIHNKPFVYGTPWSGSSPDFINSRAPLTAIVVLEQSARNAIRVLSKQEALLRLMPRCFLPYHDITLMNKAMDILDRLLSITPIYLLSCMPDRESVELVYKCVK